MYYGEAIVNSENLQEFLNTAKALKIKGLCDDEDNSSSKYLIQASLAADELKAKRSIPMATSEAASKRMNCVPCPTPQVNYQPSNQDEEVGIEWENQSEMMNESVQSFQFANFDDENQCNYEYADQLNDDQNNDFDEYWNDENTPQKIKNVSSAKRIKRSKGS